VSDSRAALRRIFQSHRDRPDSNTLSARIEHIPVVDRLHTDVLEERFGPITVRVLRHDDDVREAHLVDGRGVSRTFAITLFPREGHSRDIAEVDRAIRAGAPMGKTFVEYNYLIHKNILDIRTVRIPPWLRLAFCDQHGSTNACLIEFLVCRARERPQIYGLLAEIYHPDFRPDEQHRRSVPESAWRRTSSSGELELCQRQFSP